MRTGSEQGGFWAVFDRWTSRVSVSLYRLGVYGTLPALLVLVVLDVALRYLVGAPLQWSRDANGLLLLATLFAVLPHAWDRGHHVRMEIVYLRLPARGRSIADALSAASGVVFFALLATQAVRFAAYMLATGETGEDLAAPLWPFMAFIGLSSIVFVARLIASPGDASSAAARAREPWI